MSTRCNIVVTDAGGDKLYFYKHSDGYPSGILPILRRFLKLLKEGKIRDNVGQASGWLVRMGVDAQKRFLRDMRKKGYSMGLYTWQATDIEPTTCVHSDIAFLYTVDLGKKEIRVQAVGGGWDKQTFSEPVVDDGKKIVD